MIKQAMMTLAAVAVAGCATFQIPPDNLERNEASIRGAEEVGALGIPGAKLHLEMAKDQTEKAKQMAADGDERAVLMLARSKSDAELALGMARAAAVHDDALRAAEDLRAVQARDIH